MSKYSKAAISIERNKCEGSLVRAPNWLRLARIGSGRGDLFALSTSERMRFKCEDPRGRAQVQTVFRKRRACCVEGVLA